MDRSFLIESVGTEQPCLRQSRMGGEEYFRGKGLGKFSRGAREKSSHYFFTSPEKSPKGNLVGV